MPRSRRRPTLSEIAEAAGVHPSTASRALSGRAESVRPETAKRIKEIAVTLGYHPNPAAFSLRTGRSRTIGVIVPRLTDLVLARVFEGIDDAARDSGRTTVVSTSNDVPNIRESRLQAMLAQQPQGMIIGDARVEDDPVIEQLLASEIPFVLVNRPHPAATSVATDDRRGGALAAEHLLRLGHRRVGVIAGPSYAATCVERTLGFSTEFHNAGMPIAPEAIIASEMDTDSGFRAADALLREDCSITAIFAINDFAAIGAMSAARRHGREVGTDISVIGFNDTPLAQHLQTPLTSVASDMYRMGRLATEALNKASDGAAPPSVLLPPTLTARSSTCRVTAH